MQVFPSGEQAVVAEVRRAGETVAAAVAGQSAGIVLDRQLDVSRGDWIASAPAEGGSPRASRRRRTSRPRWPGSTPSRRRLGRKYWVRHGNRWVQARIAAIEHRLDIHTLEPTDAHELAVNEIGHVRVQTQQPLPVEPYATNRVGGALIVVDPASNRTSGALLVRAAAAA